MLGHPSIGALGEPGERAQEEGERMAAGKKLQQPGCRRAARTNRAIRNEVPRVQPALAIDGGEQPVALLALNRYGPQAMAAIPGEDLVERPLAEPAITVVENRRLAGWRAHDRG